MARLNEREYTYFSTVRGMCRFCRRIVPARVFFKDGKVWQQSLCPTCENRQALIADDKDWYLEAILQPHSDRSPIKRSYPVRNGCPFDCGPCAWHGTSCQLPVISVTNACNLKCPICFTYNRPDRIYHMSVEEMERTVDWIIESSDRVDLINITGGEPTLHPRILDLLRSCRRTEIGRITMNSNGLRLAEDPELCEQLAEMGVYVILSFNTFDHKTALTLHGKDVVGAKLRAIDNLTRAGVKMTLLHVMMRNTNENAIAGILDLMRTNDQILSLTVQTMTYTGQGGSHWPLRQHIPVDEAARIVCQQSGGAFEFPDFLPRSSSHPLCYLTCYALKSGNTFLPFARFAPSEKILSLMENSYLIRLDDEEDFFKEVINNLYSEGKTEPLKLFRELIEALYPRKREVSVFERQRLAESSVRTIYVHAHMDEDTFDCSRAMLCPDLVPSEPGKLIPACTYNLIYRMQDGRFYVDP